MPERLTLSFPAQGLRFAKVVADGDRVSATQASVANGAAGRMGKSKRKDGRLKELNASKKPPVAQEEPDESLQSPLDYVENGWAQVLDSRQRQR